MTIHDYNYKVVPKITDPGKCEMVVGDSFEGTFTMPSPPMRGNVTCVENGMGEPPMPCKRRLWIQDAGGNILAGHSPKVGTQPVINIGKNQGEWNIGPGEWTVVMDTCDENGHPYYTDGQQANSSTKLTLRP